MAHEHGYGEGAPARRTYTDRVVEVAGLAPRQAC
jgi:hypothetical protein